MKLEGKVLIAQGGGPTAVINQSLVGIILEARRYPQITKIYGALNGVSGIVDERFVDLTQETERNLEEIANTPSSALGSTRDKPDEAYCKQMFEVMRAHDIRYFFYIGGNDSSDTVRIVSEEAKKVGYDFRTMHIPKTIDNDLMGNDHTPGYGSAARFVTQCFMGANLDNRALKGVYIGIVMGRHAGFLTAASAMAQRFPDDGPHLIYLPERPFHMSQFLSDVKKVYDKYGRCVIAASEGVQDENGQPIMIKYANKVERDAYGNVQLSGSGILGDILATYIKNKFHIKRVRADTFGYLQRSFLGSVSDTDRAEAREVGEKAAQYAILHDMDGSITIQRVGDYAVDYRLTDIGQIAALTRCMPDAFINEEANHVTEAFRSYARPLLGSNMPIAGRLRAPMVKKLVR